MEIFSFGERLMIYRKRAGLSKKELAKRVGISVSTLTKYENDESQPNVDMLTDLAIALDISVMKLLSGFGDPIREKYRQGLLNISAELKMLTFFLQNPKQILSKKQILENSAGRYSHAPRERVS